jgi:hypothetical protein
VEKSVFDRQIVLGFSRILLQTFILPEKVERYIILKVIISLCKVSDFYVLTKLEFSRRILMQFRY